MEGKTCNKHTTEHVSCQMMLSAVETIEKGKAEREGHAGHASRQQLVREALSNKMTFE